MGYNISYSIYLKIPEDNMEHALAAINSLHTDEALLTYAKGGGREDKSKPVAKYKRYSWVDNPANGKFKSLEEAFNAWGLTGDEDCSYDEDGNFIVEGYYDSKIGQQTILLEAIAPYTEDTKIVVTGEDSSMWIWEILNGVFGLREGRVEFGKFEPIKILSLKDPA